MCIRDSLKEVRNSEGETVVTYEPVVERTPEVTEAHLAYVRDALHGMVQELSLIHILFNYWEAKNIQGSM